MAKKTQQTKLTCKEGILVTSVIKVAAYCRGILQDSLSLSRHPLCHPAEEDYQRRRIDEVEALTVESNTIAI
ncbi:hypothetical protein V6N11_082789 [Hibiscus sabdariffa]|uniref:Uncharacterized protein n=1 Tax=Hibiscus sabdariffa TaxID=183260 RepID=A0ABR2QKB0_9ROSI